MTVIRKISRLLGVTAVMGMSMVSLASAAGPSAASTGTLSPAAFAQAKAFVNTLLHEQEASIARNFGFIAKQNYRITNENYLMTLTPANAKQAASIQTAIKMDQLSICHLQTYLDASKLHISTVGFGLVNQVNAALARLQVYAGTNAQVAAYIAKATQLQTNNLAAFNQILTRPAASCSMPTP